MFLSKVQTPVIHQPSAEVALITSRPSKAGGTQCQLVAESAENDDTVSLPAGEEEGEGEGEGRGERGTGSGEISDLVELKMALAKQVQRLQGLCACEHNKKGGEEEEEEREREKAAEQVSLMARKLYDLQRQVTCLVLIVLGFSNKTMTTCHRTVVLNVNWCLFGVFAATSPILECHLVICYILMSITIGAPWSIGVIRCLLMCAGDHGCWWSRLQRWQRDHYSECLG